MATRRAVSAVLWSLSVSITSARSTSLHLRLDLGLQLVDLAGLDVRRRCCRWRGSGSRRRSAGSGSGRTPAAGPGRSRCERSGWVSRRPWREGFAGVGEASVPQSCVDCPSDDRRPDSAPPSRCPWPRCSGTPPTRSPRSAPASRSTTALDRCPPPARPGTQALAFHALRWLGSAEAVRRRLAAEGAAARRPTPCCSSRWPCSGRRASRPTPSTCWSTRRWRRRGGATRAAAAFVNAVLRRFVREREALVEAVAADPRGPLESSGLVAGAAAGRLARPLAGDRRRRQRPAADDPARQRPPRHGRGLSRRRSPAPGWPARRPAASPSALLRPVPVARLPGFAEGDVSVQDGNAQRAASCCWRRRSPPGARVLDACAAPGGKTAHLLERGRPRAAGDRPRPGAAGAGRRHPGPPRPARRDPRRRRRPAGETWWDGRPFAGDPARRAVQRLGHRPPPSRRPLAAPGRATSPALAATQARLLDALWPLLAPGGRLLYCTCSLFRAEGQDADRRFFATSTAMPSSPPRPPSPGHLLPLPDNDETPPAGPSAAAADGFFLPLIEKHRDHAEALDDLAAAPRLVAPPQPAACARRRGACGCCRSGAAGAAFLAGAPPARASAAELTALRPQPRRGRRLPRLRGRVRARAQRRRRPGQVGAAVLRRRGRDLPRPLVLARPPGRPCGAHLADRLPAAHLDLPRDDGRRPEPDLRRPAPRRSPRSAGRRAGRWPSRASSRRAAATTSSSSTGSTPPSCRGRCRSASAASPTGSFRSSAHCASTEARWTPTMARPPPRPARPFPA